MTSFDRNMLAAGLVLVSTILALAIRFIEQRTRTATIAQAVCHVDVVAQPLDVALDTATVHPAIVAACASIGGQPVGAVAAPVDEVAETPATQ